MKCCVNRFLFYIYSVEKFTLKQAVELIGKGATYRAVEYYKAIYSNDVEKIGGMYYVNQAFIDKVKKNRALIGKDIEDKRTRAELLKEIERLESEIKSLKNNNSFELKDNERIEVFTDDEYKLFSERLIEWRIQRKEIEQHKTHFKDLESEKEFIKKQLEYFKISNDRILEQHEKLIEIIGQRNRIEAVEKKVIPREPNEI